MMLVKMGIQFSFEDQALRQEDTHWLYSFFSLSKDDDDDYGGGGDGGGNLIWLWAPRDMSGRNTLYSSHKYDDVTTNMFQTTMG